MRHNVDRTGGGSGWHRVGGPCDPDRGAPGQGACGSGRAAPTGSDPPLSVTRSMMGLPVTVERGGAGSVALHVHRAGRADHLVQALGEVLSDPLPDPMALDVVSVPARGIERWITQQLSHRLGRGARDAGICAGVRFPSPAALVAEVVGARNADPWTPDRLVWPLLSAIDSAMGRPWAETLTRHLGGVAGEGGRRGRRYAVARRLAGLFDSYATYRPSMLRDWAVGDDTDGAGMPLAADLGWQPHLWRLVRAGVPEPDPVQRMQIRAGGAAPRPGGGRPSRSTLAVRAVPVAGRAARRDRGPRPVAGRAPVVTRTRRPRCGPR